jgi:hypothetical protein
MSLVDYPVGQPSLDISPIWTPIILADVKKYIYVSVHCRLCFNFFYVGAMQRICLFGDDYNSDITLILTTIAVK